MGSYVANWVNKVHPATTVVIPSRLNTQYANGVHFGELLVSLGWLSSAEFGSKMLSMTRNMNEKLINMDVIVRVLKGQVMTSWDGSEVFVFDHEKISALVPRIVTGTLVSKAGREAAVWL
jgi:hypothetical protein